jgi:hypothetical protein
MTLEIHVLVWHRHTHVLGLNRLMRSQPSFDNLCIFKSYRDRNLQINHKCWTECCIALYICGVNIWQLYKSNFLVDIFFFFVTGLTPAHVYACVKPGRGFPTSYVFIMFNELRWDMIVRFVDIARNVGDHCLIFLFLTLFKSWLIGWFH